MKLQWCHLCSGVSGQTADAAASASSMADIMADILKVWRVIKNKTPSIDVQLLKEQSCKTTSQSNLNWQSLKLFLKSIAPTTTRRITRRWVAIRDQFLEMVQKLLDQDRNFFSNCIISRQKYTRIQNEKQQNHLWNRMQLQWLTSND